MKTNAILSLLLFSCARLFGQDPYVPTDAYPANVDYASGNYGAYSQVALTDGSIQGVVCNLDWNQVETDEGSFNWAPLDDVLQAWSAVGKHVVIVARYASEMGGTGGQDGALPAWEAAKIPTLNDPDTGYIVPDHFDATFQTDWEGFVGALGDHLESSDSEYLSAISYVRVACGLGAEGFYLMDPSGPNWSTDDDQMKTWAGAGTDNATLSDAWRAFQENMLTYYRSKIPTGIPVIYPIVDPKDQYWTCSDNNLVDVDVAEWAIPQGGFGLGQEGLPDTSGSYGGYNDYAGMNILMPWVNANYTDTYIQFQAENSLVTDQVAQSIANTESILGRTIEWYEDTATDSGYSADFNGFQTWVNGKNWGVPARAPYVVADYEAGGTDGSSYNVNVTNALTAGDTALVIVGNSSAGDTLAWVTDSENNAYTAVNASHSDRPVAFGYSVMAAGLAKNQSITVKLNVGNVAVRVIVLGLPGVVGVDRTAGAGTDGASSFSVATGSLQTQNEICVGAISSGGSTNPSVAGPFTDSQYESSSPVLTEAYALPGASIESQPFSGTLTDGTAYDAGVITFMTEL